MSPDTIFRMYGSEVRFFQFVKSLEISPAQNFLTLCRKYGIKSEDKKVSRSDTLVFIVSNAL